MTRVKLKGENAEVEMTGEEFEKVKDLLEREPNITELGMFDVMWSEHCSYKSSRPKLRLFEDAESNYDYVLAGPGQDAGVIDMAQEVIAIGGSGSGADTAMVIKPAHAQNYLDLKVLEIICKPREP